MGTEALERLDQVAVLRLRERLVAVRDVLLGAGVDHLERVVGDEVAMGLGAADEEEVLEVDDRRLVPRALQLSGELRDTEVQAGE